MEIPRHPFHIWEWIPGNGSWGMTSIPRDPFPGMHSQGSIPRDPKTSIPDVEWMSLDKKRSLGAVSVIYKTSIPRDKDREKRP